MSRLVIIDDTNPSIQYSGPWFEVTNNSLPLHTDSEKGLVSDYGPPFQNTLHGINVNASLSFNFSGSAVIVYGTSITANASGNQLDGTQDPIWECFIDDFSIDSTLPSGTFGNLNNWILCGAGPGPAPGQLLDGPHLLTVNASVSKQTFWFDQIQYAPSANVSFNQSILRIDANDSAIQYSPGWEFTADSDNLDPLPIDYTSTPFGNSSFAGINGENLTYEFSGTSISMFGTLMQLSTQPASPGPLFFANYTIDDQEPITFNVGNTSESIIVYNKIFFESGQLSPGQHKLVVTYIGSNNTPADAVMDFNYFVQFGVQQDVLAPSSTLSILNNPTNVPSDSSTPTSISAPSGSPSSSSPGSPTHAIIGGVIGGLVFISLLIALFFFLCRRYNRRRSNAPSEMSYTLPSPDVVSPFTLPPLNPTSTFLPENYTSNGQSLPSRLISSKFSHQNQPSDPASTSTGNSGGFPPLTPLRRESRFPSPTFISPSPESPRLPLTGSQPNLDSARPRVLQATTEPSIQRSLSPQRANLNTRFLWHKDSGVRIPPAEDEIVETPPLYTPASG